MKRIVSIVVWTIFGGSFVVGIRLAVFPLLGRGWNPIHSFEWGIVVAAAIIINLIYIRHDMEIEKQKSESVAGNTFQIEEERYEEIKNKY